MDKKLYGAAVDFGCNIINSIVKLFKFIDDQLLSSRAVLQVVQDKPKIACVFEKKIFRQIRFLWHSRRGISSQVPFTIKLKFRKLIA